MSADKPERRIFRKSVVLFVASAATASALILPDQRYTLQQIGVVLLVPAAAAAAMSLMAEVVPSLFPEAKYFLPGCVTLPLAHASLVAAVASLATTTVVGIQSPPESYSAALEWLVPRNLAIATFVQAIALAADACALRLAARCRRAEAE